MDGPSGSPWPPTIPCAPIHLHRWHGGAAPPLLPKAHHGEGSRLDLTEPTAGLRCRRHGAPPRADTRAWVLNGAKTFTTHGSVGDVVVVSPSPTRRAKHGISAFAWRTEAGVPGRQEGKQDGASRLPTRRGRDGGLPPGRPTAAGTGGRDSWTPCASWTGDASASPPPGPGYGARRLRRALPYARAQAVRPSIAEFQAVQFMLADRPPRSTPPPCQVPRPG